MFIIQLFEIKADLYDNIESVISKCVNHGQLKDLNYVKSRHFSQMSKMQSNSFLMFPKNILTFPD